MDERITSLEVRVGGIEDGIKTIVGKLDSRDRMPWGVIGTFAGVMLTIVAGIGGLAFRPLSDGIGDLKAALIEMKSESRRYVPREDLDARFAGSGERMKRVERDLDSVQAQVVPREEHKQRWTEHDREMDRVDKRLDRLEAVRLKP